MTIAQKTSLRMSLENAPEDRLLYAEISAPRPCPRGGISPRLPTAASHEKVDDMSQTLCTIPPVHLQAILDPVRISGVDCISGADRISGVDRISCVVRIESPQPASAWLPQ
jgi:hypothetical protein